MESYDNQMAPKPFNTLGLIGFVFSLTCIGSPIGFLLSLIAMFKPAKGFAIAGLIIGILGTGAIGMGAVGVSQLSNMAKFPSATTYVEYIWDGWQLQVQLELYVDEHHALPASIDDLGAEESNTLDPWGQKYRLKLLPEEFDFNGQLGPGSFRVLALATAGPDQEWGTEDDRPFPEQKVAPNFGYLNIEVGRLKSPEPNEVPEADDQDQPDDQDDK